MTGRGGRRAGAGAPRGNKNRLVSGRYSGDPDTRRVSAALASLPIDVRRQLLPYVKEGLGSIKRRLAWVVPELRQANAPANIVHFPTATTTTPPVQSNAHLAPLVLRLTAAGLFGAGPFVHDHAPAAGILDAVLDHVEEHPDGIYNPGALIRYLVHQELAEPAEGGGQRCPYCRWTDRRQREESTS
ncbi:MAG TPA: hypothetical protein VJN32_00200 [Dehalococcoidia bacterium]|nr:hypothetical protein [Dehalococcoidia bacterium]